MHSQSVMLCLNVRKLVLYTNGEDDGLRRWSLFYIFLCNNSFCFPFASGVEPQHCSHVDWSANQGPARGGGPHCDVWDQYRRSLSRQTYRSWRQHELSGIFCFTRIEGRLADLGLGRLKKKTVAFSPGIKKTVLLLLTVVKWIHHYRVLQRGQSLFPVSE